MFTNSKNTSFDILLAYLSAYDLSILKSKNYKDIVGVFYFLVAVIKISLNLGIPNVTFFSPCPAKWKVFNVIYVDGSPID